MLSSQEVCKKSITRLKTRYIKVSFCPVLLCFESEPVIYYMTQSSDP